MFNYVVETIRSLSQEEGLWDSEIAERLGCCRATVNRARIDHGIPKAITENRKDKSYVCSGCGETVLIRRRESRKAYCDDCQKKIQHDSKSAAKEAFRQSQSGKPVLDAV